MFNSEGESHWWIFAGMPARLGLGYLKGNIYINDHDHIWGGENIKNNTRSYKSFLTL